MIEPLMFTESNPGKQGWSLPKTGRLPAEFERMIPEHLKRRSSAALPELTEPEIVRHFTRLSQKNFSIDTHFYPLGSCTMKYNPKVHEEAAALKGFRRLHPYADDADAQGILALLFELDRYLSVITGMDRFTLQPAAGAQGEFCGMMIIRAWHNDRGEKKRNVVIVPDSSHGTNPASAALYGFRVAEVKSDARGRVDLKALEKLVSDETACLMLTNPNTLGLFEDEILKITKLIHERGALAYYDGANMNALLGITRPGDMGFDVVHLNLHKTFSTPHGGGGPGSGPVGVKEKLIPYLPDPLVERNEKTHAYHWGYRDGKSVGRLKAFYGNVGMLIRAYMYIRMLGERGLRRVSEDAVINANYLKKKLAPLFEDPYPEFCMHEFVLSARQMGRQKGIHALDIGKRLLDYGFHAPTVHFPLIVPDALMIEPTETESKETLDKFVKAMTAIAEEIKRCPEMVKEAPHDLPIRRLDDVKAAREPKLIYSNRPEQKSVHV